MEQSAEFAIGSKIRVALVADPDLMFQKKIKIFNLILMK